MRSLIVAVSFGVVIGIAAVSPSRAGELADSGRAAAFLSHAMRHFNSAEYREALRLFDKLDSSQSDNSLDYYRGVCYYQLGSYASAIACLRKVGRSDSLYALASFYLAETMVAVHDLRAAVASLESSLAADSSYLPARLEYIKTLCAIDSFRKAEQFVNERENDDEALALAQQLVITKNFNDAYPYLAQVVSRDTSNSLGHLLLGEVYYQTQKYAYAARVYLWMLSAFGPTPFVLKRLALCYGNMDGRPNLEKAIAAMSRCLAVSRDTSGNDLEHIGAWYYKLEKYDSTELYFRHAVERDPSDPGARLNMGLTLMKLGRHDDAIKSISLAYSLSKKSMGFSISILKSLGAAELRANKIAAAIKDYRLVLRIHPSDPEAAYGLGVAFDQARDTLDAVYWYKRYMSIKDKSGLNPEFIEYVESRIDSLSAKRNEQ